MPTVKFDTSSRPSQFQRVIYDAATERYTNEEGTPLLFPKQLKVRFDGQEVETLPLKFTRNVMGLDTTAPVPCLKAGDGEKIFLDDPSLEIAVECCALDE